MAGFPERVLVVDDDETLLEVEELALRRVGDIEIQTCESCDHAVSVVEMFVPDLILLDLKMPDKDGTDAVREFRQVEKLANTPIVFVTGEDKVVMLDEYKKLGVLGVIHKPFKPSDFVMNIQKLWQAHRFSGDE